MLKLKERHDSNLRRDSWSEEPFIFPLASWWEASSKTSNSDSEITLKAKNANPRQPCVLLH